MFWWREHRGSVVGIFSFFVPKMGGFDDDDDVGSGEAGK